MSDLQISLEIDVSRTIGGQEGGDVFDYSLVDAEAIERYNRCRHISSKTRLQVEMGAAPFDGDPYSANIVLLLNNPMYCDHSVPEDHALRFDGWPLAGLHPSVRPGFRNWYYRPLGYLINYARRFTADAESAAQLVSQRVAIVQIIPWASRSFHLGCVLPSRERHVVIARQAIERGAVVIIGRSIRFWTGEVGSANNIFVARNVLNPTISPGGLGMSQEDFDSRLWPFFW